MCEILTFAFQTPHALGPLLERALDVEPLGIDGFGWGAAWLDPSGRVEGYRHPTSLAADDEGRRQLSDTESVRFLIHLRRPSLLSTIQLADTQPFVDPEGRFAFAHNGRFDHHESYRSRYEAALKGRGDSEVGLALFNSRLDHEAPGSALVNTLTELGGYSNLVYLGADGEMVAVGANHLNPFWRFRLGDAEVACTACHSDDRSLFDLVFTDADDEAPIGPAAEPIAPPINATSSWHSKEPNR